MTAWRRPRPRRARRASRRPARRPRRACDWKKPKPLASSAGIRLRSDTSLTSMTSRIAVARLVAAGALRHVADDHRDLALEVDAPGFVGQRDRDRAARGSASEPPWYIRGSVQKLPASPRRAPGAPARRGSRRPSRPPTGRRAAGARRLVLVEALARHAHRCSSAVGERRQARRDAVPVVERRLQRRRDGIGSVQRVRSRETTTRRPSRLPSFRRRELHGRCFTGPGTQSRGAGIEVLLQAGPAVDVVVLQAFPVRPRSR